MSSWPSGAVGSVGAGAASFGAFGVFGAFGGAPNNSPCGAPFAATCGPRSSSRRARSTSSSAMRSLISARRSRASGERSPLRDSSSKLNAPRSVTTSSSLRAASSGSSATPFSVASSRVNSGLGIGCFCVPRAVVRSSSAVGVGVGASGSARCKTLLRAPSGVITSRVFSGSIGLGVSAAPNSVACGPSKRRAVVSRMFFSSSFLARASARAFSSCSRAACRRSSASVGSPGLGLVVLARRPMAASRIPCTSAPVAPP